MRRIRFPTIADLCEAYPILAGDRSSVGGEEPIAFLEKALRNGRAIDVLDICAFVLPRREAIWWGCRCVAEREGGLNAESGRIWDIAAAWVMHADEKRRRFAYLHAEVADPDQPEGWLLWAVVWSGGPMEPDMAQSVVAPADLCGKALVNAVRVAVARLDPPVASTMAARFLAIALDIAASDGDVGAEVERMLAGRRSGRPSL